MRTSLNLVLLAAVSGILATPAKAQVDLYLTIADNTECHFLTDARGLEPHETIMGALRATGAFIEGEGCVGESGGVGDPPPAPVINLNVPSAYSAESTSPLAISWQAFADQCNYDLPTGWAAAPSIACSDMNQCLNGSASVTVPSSVPLGTYQVGLNCTRLGGPGSAASAEADVQITSAPPPASCPPATAPRQTVGKIFFWSTPNAEEDNVNLEHWGNVFGRTKSNPNPLEWPSRNNKVRTFYAAKGHYIALKFTVPVVNPPSEGTMQFSDSLMAPTVQNGKVSYSKCPGDFGQAGSEIDTACLYNNKSFGGGMHPWKTAGSGVTSNYCELARGETYYLNMLSNCESAECRYTLKNVVIGPSSTGEILGIRILLDLADLGEGD